MGDFRIEDIYFTGILRQKAGIKKINEYRKTFIWLDRKFKGKTTKHQYVGEHF